MRILIRDQDGDALTLVEARSVFYFGDESIKGMVIEVTDKDYWTASMPEQQCEGFLLQGLATGYIDCSKFRFKSGSFEDL